MSNVYCIDRMVGEDETSDATVFNLKEDIVFDIENFTVSQDLLNCNDVWALKIEDRHMLYKYW